MKAGRLAKSGWGLFLGVLLVAGCGGGGGEANRPLPRLNAEPVLSSVRDRTVPPGEPLSIVLSASDAEGDPLTFRVEGLPAGASFDPASATFTWIPEAGEAGIHYVAFVVSDPTGTDFETVALTILPETFTPPPSGGTVFGQSLSAQDQDGDIFPGQGNFWDIAPDFSLGNGGDDQFEGAMALSVVTTEGETDFPAILYDNLRWNANAPFFTQADGVKTVALSGPDLALAGSYSALLNGTSDSRLQQTVDLSAVPAGTALSLTWAVEAFLSPGNFQDGAAFLRLVVRDLDGVLEDSSILLSEPAHPDLLDLSPFIGRRIQIFFEARNTHYGFIAIDDVSLRDASGREYLVNGSFEAGDLRGWNTRLIRESQNVYHISPPDLAGVRMTRSFYTHPARKWGRWVDLLENSGATPVDVTVRYRTTLGASIVTETNPALGTARIYPTPGAPGALSAWDAAEFLKKNGVISTNVFGTRDVGLVFGDMTAHFVSRGNTAGLPPSPDIFLEKTISVPAGGKKALVTFVVMDVVDTGETARNLNALASGVDAANQAIVRDFWTDPQYREYLPELVTEEMIANFPRP